MEWLSIYFNFKTLPILEGEYGSNLGFYLQFLKFYQTQGSEMIRDDFIKLHDQENIGFDTKIMILAALVVEILAFLDIAEGHFDINGHKIQKTGLKNWQHDFSAT